MFFGSVYCRVVVHQACLDLSAPVLFSELRRFFWATLYGPDDMYHRDVWGKSASVIKYLVQFSTHFFTNFSSRSCLWWKITWLLWDPGTILQHHYFVWTSSTRKKWSTITHQTSKQRSKVKRTRQIENFCNFYGILKSDFRFLPISREFFFLNCIVEKPHEEKMVYNDTSDIKAKILD